MASSPPAPFPASLPNPRKRPSISSQVSQSASNKRPKLHPLRQTSFPANGDAHAYSAVAGARSETGSIANSTFSAVSATRSQPRGRGRPRKTVQVTDENAHTYQDGASQAGNKNSQARSVISTARSALGANPDDEPDDEEDDEPDLLEHEGDDQEQRKDEERFAKFTGQLTQKQSERYNYYRSSKLKESVVKRIVNQTVSQSVTSTAIQAVQYFSKAFAIEMIERAREVQLEWAKAADAATQAEKERLKQKLQDKEKALQDTEKTLRQQDPPAAMPEQEKRAFLSEIRTLQEEADRYTPNKHKGGLLPDHLREALRRYKADGEGNGFGFDGLSHPLLGVHGATAWRIGDGASGQRLFR